MNTFFISDTHLRHSAIIRFCQRPFSSVEEMDETIIRNWNAKVKPGDRVYHCGDFCFGNREEILAMTRRLRGHYCTGVTLKSQTLNELSAGAGVAVAAGLDLVEVAYQFSIDNKAQVEFWLKAGQVHRVTDAQARQWLDADALLWTTVVRPWVLVQG